MVVLAALLLAAGATAAHTGIDVNSERMITLAQLARRLPCRRGDRPVSPATIHRWRNPGLRGVRLACAKIGGIWHTSLEAYQRWVERLTAAAESVDPVVPSSNPSPSDTAQSGAPSEAERRLQALDPLD
jgi:hypothetical protein